MDERERRLIKSLTSLLLFNILLIPIAWASIISLLWLLALLGIEIMRMEERLDSNKLDCIKHRNEEFVGVAESPSITFSRVNEFEAGASYRR